MDDYPRIPLEELLPRVDVLSLHCLLTDETRDLIGARELKLMKPDSLLINTSRGGLVNEQALADALRAGEIGGAGFDVLTEEPPRHGNPLLADDIPNLIITPHSACGSALSVLLLSTWRRGLSKPLRRQCALTFDYIVIQTLAKGRESAILGPDWISV